jgi:hypothetical protein
MAHPQEKHQLLQPQMAIYVTQEPEKSPASNATADTNTRKNDRYSTASLKTAT